MKNSKFLTVRNFCNLLQSFNKQTWLKVTTIKYTKRYENKWYFGKYQLDVNLDKLFYLYVNKRLLYGLKTEDGFKRNVDKTQANYSQKMSKNLTCWN